MRTLLIALTLALPLAASAASPASQYDDVSYPPDAHAQTTLRETPRAPNAHDDAGLNGAVLEQTQAAPSSAQASSQRSSTCHCS